MTHGYCWVNDAEIPCCREGFGQTTPKSRADRAPTAGAASHYDEKWIKGKLVYVENHPDVIQQYLAFVTQQKMAIELLLPCEGLIDKQAKKRTRRTIDLTLYALRP